MTDVLTSETFVAASDYEGLLNRIANRIRQSLELGEILTTTVAEIRGILGTNRVKIYRFHSDGDGEVIAESRDSAASNPLPSLLGLRFPAGDIPPHALELFIKARQRVIIDVTAHRQVLARLDCADTGTCLDKEDIRYAPVDSCHVQYLTAMGVASSLTLPIVHQGQLWGLFVSHHSQPHHFSERELGFVQLLVDQLSIAIAQANLLSQARRQSWQESKINGISSLLLMPSEMTVIRQQVLEFAVEAIQGSGGRLYITAEPTGQGSQLYCCGQQPASQWLEETQLWQDTLVLFTDAELDSNAETSRQEGHSQPKPSDIKEPSPVRQVLNAFTAIDKAKVALETEQADSNPALKAIAAIDNFKAALSHQQAGSSSVFSGSSQMGICVVDDLYKDDRFQPLVPAFESTTIRSVLIVPLQYQQQCIGFLSIFRDEIETETLWAGKSNADERNIRPRESFEAWCEIKKAQAEKWTPSEVSLAQALGTHIYMAVMQRRVENIVRHQASHDALTGLPNRLLFNDHLSLALASAQQYGELLAVIFLDLDRFKTINDTLGHVTGDHLLQVAAQRLRTCLRDGDTIARWGGDEFTLLFPKLSCSEEAIKIAQRILNVFNDPFLLEGKEFHVKASLGIALAPYDGEDAETLLKNADAAMYRVKQQGKNNFQVYSPAINTKALEQLTLENNLHKALDRREFLLHYQPQVDLKTGQIVATEALVRWNHPILGLVPPNNFIPLAEETGLICAIGEWVLHTACAQNKAWQQMGMPPLRMAVNLSARQFQQQNLVSMIEKTLQETGLDPQYLELEITESIAIKDTKLTIDVLNKLRNMGISVSMDDFGTGYSSLSSLIGFPFHVLKIDRSFICDALSNSSKAEIVKAIVILGHTLNLQVVAEGVEEADQVEFLRSIECDSMQGYFFSRPLPADAVTEFMTQKLSLVY